MVEKAVLKGERRQQVELYSSDNVLKMLEQFYKLIPLSFNLEDKIWRNCSTSSEILSSLSSLL